MTIKIRRLTPLPDSTLRERRDALVTWWNGFSVGDDTEGVPGDLARETEAHVTELLQTGRPEDLVLAERLTAEFRYKWASG